MTTILAEPITARTDACSDWNGVALTRRVPMFQLTFLPEAKAGLSAALREAADQLTVDVEELLTGCSGDCWWQVDTDELTVVVHTPLDGVDLRFEVPGELWDFKFVSHQLH